MKKSLTKISLKPIALFLAFAMALSLCACGSAAPGGSAASGESPASSGSESSPSGTGSGSSQLTGTYEITVWCPEAAVSLISEQIDAFNRSNTDGIVIHAAVKAVKEAEAAASQIADPESDGDLYCFTQDQTAHLIRAGALAKLGKAAASDVEDNNDAASVSAAESGGELYAYPLAISEGSIMYYDKSIIPEDDLGSLEKLLKDCEKNGRSFSFDVNNGWYAASFFFAAGCRSEWEYDDAGKAVSCRDSFNSPEGLIAVKGMKTLVGSKAYRSSSSGADFSAAAPSAVVISGIEEAQTVKDILGDNFGAAELPSFTVGGKSYHLGSFSACSLIGVKPQADAAKQAVLHRLAQFLTDEECSLQRFEKLGWAPSNLSALASDSAAASPALAALVSQNALSVPQGKISDGWWAIAGAVAAGVKKASDEKGLQAVLDTYKAALGRIVDIPEDETALFTVIGTIDGTNWDKDFAMTQESENVWVTADPIKLKAGDAFRVRQGMSWDISYGSDPSDGQSNLNYSVKESGLFYIRFVNDGKTGITLEKVEEETGWTVIGTIAGSSWDKDFAMEPQENGTFRSVDVFELEAGAELKVRQTADPSIAYGNGTESFVVDAAGRYFVVFDPETAEVTLEAE